MSKQHSVRLICKTLNISRSTINREVTETKSKRREVEITTRIREIHEESNKIYGSPKIHSELIKAGYIIALRTVSKYMFKAGIKSIRQKKFKVSKSSALKQCRVNYLKDVEVNAAHTYISTDITYIWTMKGWVYLCSFMDLYTRKIIMWDVGYEMSGEFVNEVLIKLLIKYPTIKMIHSDQGSQYTSQSYQNIVLNNEAICSYSKKGYPYHNAWIETYHASLKHEKLYHMSLETISDCYLAVYSYNEWYNNNRVHQSLNYMTPVQYENKISQIMI